MIELWTTAALWIGLALLAGLLASWLGIVTALSEISVGIFAQFFAGLMGISLLPGVNDSWVKFLAGAGAILVTFLAGAERDPDVFKRKWKQATAIGVIILLVGFCGCTAAAFYILHWSVHASWLAGIPLSAPSVAVVYAVMLEFGLQRTEYGKTVLAAFFVNGLGTVCALGFLFAPFDWKTLVFVSATVVLCLPLPFVTKALRRRFGNKPSEMEAKYLLLLLFGMSALALWAGSEPVLPAYIIGMTLAATVGRDHALMRKLRSIAFGLLTPFYFLRAGSLASLPVIVSAPFAFGLLFAVKMLTKLFSVFAVTRIARAPFKEGMYTTLLMAAGLTFGSIASLFGLNHGLVDQVQYSYLIATVVMSAVVPTLLANAWFLPRHLLPADEPAERV